MFVATMKTLLTGLVHITRQSWETPGLRTKPKMGGGGGGTRTIEGKGFTQTTTMFPQNLCNTYSYIGVKVSLFVIKYIVQTIADCVPIIVEPVHPLRKCVTLQVYCTLVI